MVGGRVRAAWLTAFPLLASLAAADLAPMPPLATKLDLPGRQTAEGFGESVVALDMNGDGWQDVAVGGPGFDRGNTVNSGRVAVFLGGPAPDTIEVATSSQGATYEGTGSVLAAGDVNGDGFDDLVIGVAFQILDQTVVRIALGSATPNLAADRVLSGPYLPEAFGRSVACLDLDRDGFDDVVVGEWAVRGEFRRENAWVFRGSPSMDMDYDLSLEGDAWDSFASGNDFGAWIAPAGDFNGDGFGDVVIGDPGRQNQNPPPVGAAFLFLGGRANDGAYDLKFNGAFSGDQFGRIVSGIGDVNGDGFDDVAVAEMEGGTLARGAVIVHLGGRTLDAGRDARLEGEAIGDRFGTAIAPLGDFDGDGLDDFAIGAPGNDAGGTESGAVYVVSGSRTLQFTTRRFSGARAENLGASLSGMREFAGVTHPHLVVGAPGAISNAGRTGRARVLGFESVGLLDPVGGESWIAGEPAHVRWSGRTPVDIEWRTPGVAWSPLASAAGGAKLNDWTVTAPAPADSVYLRVSMTGIATGPYSTSECTNPLRVLVRPYLPEAAALVAPIATGTQAGGMRGFDVVAAGDVDGDGRDDVFEAEHADARTDRWTLHLAADAATAAASFALPVAEPGAHALVAVGDVTGDGRADALALVNGGARLLGGGVPFDTSAALELSLPGERVVAACGAGDTDGDGANDLALATLDAASHAHVCVWRGGAPLDATPDAALQIPDSLVSRTLALVSGDFDGDGRTDLALGLPDAARAGAALVWFGGARTLVAVGETPGEGFGAALAMPGDVDLDGYDDLLVAAPFANASRGRVALLRGYVAMKSIPAAVFEGERPGDLCGLALSRAGDANADGFPDFWLGAPAAARGAGEARLVFGGYAPGPESVRAFEGSAAGDAFGSAIACALDAPSGAWPGAWIGAPFADANDAADAGAIARLAFARYVVTSPRSGAALRAGAPLHVAWRGAEGARVTLHGASGDSLALGTFERGVASCDAVVPQGLGAWLLVRVAPLVPGVSGEAWSDTVALARSVTLERFETRALHRAVELDWSTVPRPGEQGLRAYRVRRLDAAGAVELAPDSLTVSSLTDHDGYPGARYRLAIVDGLGVEWPLGEAQAPIGVRGLAVGPSPWRGGPLSISLALGGLTGDATPADFRLELFDVSGRRVAEIARGVRPTMLGVLRLDWEGASTSGNPPAPGWYLLRARAPSAGLDLRRRVIRAP